MEQPRACARAASVSLGCRIDVAIFWITGFGRHLRVEVRFFAAKGEHVTGPGGGGLRLWRVFCLCGMILFIPWILCIHPESVPWIEWQPGLWIQATFGELSCRFWFWSYFYSSWSSSLRVHPGRLVDLYPLLYLVSFRPDKVLFLVRKGDASSCCTIFGYRITNHVCCKRQFNNKYTYFCSDCSIDCNI